jgi:sugar phosphate isomerase/epimerase
VPDLSVQLYTVRTALAEDVDGTLARLAEFGFTNVEPFQLTEFGDALKTGLARHNLAAPTAHARIVGEDQDALFDLAAQLGVGTVIDPRVDVARWQSADGVARVADDINEAATKAAEYGVRVGYHNHNQELESKIDGRHALEVFADQLAPDVVLEVDTYWAYAGGADVPALLQRLGDRVVALHVKDGDGSLDPKRQVAVGSGTLPVWDIVEAAPDALRVVELDDTEGDVVEAVRASREFLLTGRR